MNRRKQYILRQKVRRIAIRTVKATFPFFSIFIPTFVTFEIGYMLGHVQHTCPVPEVRMIIVSPTPTVTPKQSIRGKASYYSLAGCLGCSTTFTMANGQKLDDTRRTLAYNHVQLNTEVIVKNVRTGVQTTAVVTDRGGFEKYGKIADLSIATKEAIGCGDFCDIEIIFNK